MELTDRSRANIAKGNKHGAGTDSCRKCHGPKEAKRLNSDTCVTCQREGQVARVSLEDRVAALETRCDNQRDEILRLRKKLATLEKTVMGA